MGLHGGGHSRADREKQEPIALCRGFSGSGDLQCPGLFSRQPFDFRFSRVSNCKRVEVQRPPMNCNRTGEFETEMQALGWWYQHFEFPPMESRPEPVNLQDMTPVHDGRS